MKNKVQIGVKFGDFFSHRYQTMPTVGWAIYCGTPLTIKDNLMGNVKIEPQQRELVSLLLDRHEIAVQMDPTGNFASTLQALLLLL